MPGRFNIGSNGFNIGGNGFNIWGNGFNIRGNGFNIGGNGFNIRGNGLTLYHRVEGTNAKGNNLRKRCKLSLYGSVCSSDGGGWKCNCAFCHISSFSAHHRPL
jgi:hypothetical protein